jgi:hypothetical protein
MRLSTTLDFNLPLRFAVESKIIISRSCVFTGIRWLKCFHRVLGYRYTRKGKPDQHPYIAGE